ncbi:conserved hypothetical protein [Verticillium alfalfae VaMs.102]|uniref:Uncharacterized protein n=1 Tax=Verticillium alfalfae (strain VaMs.102 / ATCC MYA-4576 / FGSC 10136) TaxID=526221 RepID=C9SJZ2_VERA1|nr:conserved hypothetical protein [Verticillium alfalfae VaMs.102]EEY19010.1 conserved hypothetical protein [Verticillium alfalfae VaMs.102]
MKILYRFWVDYLAGEGIDTAMVADFCRAAMSGLEQHPSCPAGVAYLSSVFDRLHAQDRRRERAACGPALLTTAGVSSPGAKPA